MSKPKTDLWYPFFVGDYRKDTARLSCEQHGAYRQLIDEYWITGPLPDDDAILARIVGLDLKAWKKHRPTIEAFFRIKGGVWRHKRVDSERSKASTRKTKAVERAKAAAGARWGSGDAQSNAYSMQQASSEQCLSNALHNSPSPSQAPPIQASEEVTEDGEVVLAPVVRLGVVR
jgi:uncharacterized protein YdaU (DUF1376 family)